MIPVLLGRIFDVWSQEILHKQRDSAELNVGTSKYNFKKRITNDIIITRNDELF